MRHNRFVSVVFLLVGTFDLVCRGAGTPTSQPVTSADNTFAFTISKDWERVAKNKSADGTLMEIRLNKDGREFASITVDGDRAPSDLDKFLRLQIAGYKDSYPELNKDIAVETVKLDGSDARVVRYQEPDSHYTVYSVIRDGRLFEIECYARDIDLKEMQMRDQEVMNTFKWIKPKQLVDK